MIIQRIRPLANDQWRIRPLANDHPEDPASCKWSAAASGLLQMIIRRIRPLANDQLEGQATCKWSGLLQMIIWRIWSFSNDQLEGQATCKWSSLLQMVKHQYRIVFGQYRMLFFEVTLVTCIVKNIALLKKVNISPPLTQPSNPTVCKKMKKNKMESKTVLTICKQITWNDDLQKNAISWKFVWNKRLQNLDTKKNKVYKKFG